MNWLFHILIALFFYNSNLNLTWFLIGNVVLDLFFILSFMQVSRFNLRKINNELKDEGKVRKLLLHKIGYFVHGLPFFILVLIVALLTKTIWVNSLALGMSLHLLLDFFSHIPQPNPLFYPFSEKRYETGIIDWSIRKSKLAIYGLIGMILLLALKYAFFGFII